MGNKKSSRGVRRVCVNGARVKAVWPRTVKHEVALILIVRVVRDGLDRGDVLGGERHGGLAAASELSVGSKFVVLNWGLVSMRGIFATMFRRLFSSDTAITDPGQNKFSGGVALHPKTDFRGPLRRRRKFSVKPSGS